MGLEQTLLIVKPDALSKGYLGEIISHLEGERLEIIGMQMVRLSTPQAAEFYGVHRDKSFFSGLVEFMVSGRVVVMVLQGVNAVVRVREIMGTTDPSFAAPNTLRRRFGETIRRNAVHGSDSIETAQFEVGFFFPIGRALDYTIGLENPSCGRGGD